MQITWTVSFSLVYFMINLSYAPDQIQWAWPYNFYTRNSRACLEEIWVHLNSCFFFFGSVCCSLSSFVRLVIFWCLCYALKVYVFNWPSVYSILCSAPTFVLEIFIVSFHRQFVLLFISSHVYFYIEIDSFAHSLQNLLISFSSASNTFLFLQLARI